MLYTQHAYLVLLVLVGKHVPEYVATFIIGLWLVLLTLLLLGLVDDCEAASALSSAAAPGMDAGWALGELALCAGGRVNRSAERAVRTTS
jgi:hypothetical protein